MIGGARALLVMAVMAVVPMTGARAETRPALAERAIPPLKPGQSVWFETPEMLRASTGEGAPLRIVVAIRQQQALVYRGNRLAGVTTVSTGSPGYETPLGEFTILEKKLFHRSNLYSNAPMPYMQRLTWGGVALHAGELPGYPASHGCIRLPKAFARQLFDLTTMGGTVLVVDDVADAPLYLPLEPVLMADTRRLRTAVTSYTPPPPLLAAETDGLGGGAYDVLTMGGESPAPSRKRTSSWVTGPAPEAGQTPLTRGSR
ncbi:L,D-transpeptidase family protein [Sphingomonas psychrotolerans]|uniref:L,D-transpeptidase family protein n=1 Tax=Sphingomonas psychrotolerans TaxID=1327635 RepID=A0ABU3N100_9SPHN|nr:L,D-transpeptidase family protein [Sphingomonas psychrotolerans]MDT8757442.1 L,D-transpeptidase family protein [Sphingomonas psychrotolerans]